MRVIGSGRDSEPAMDRRNELASAFRPRRSRRISAVDAISCCFLVLVSVRRTGGRHSLEDAKLGDSGRCGDVCALCANRPPPPTCLVKLPFPDRPFPTAACPHGG